MDPHVEHMDASTANYMVFPTCVSVAWASVCEEPAGPVGNTVLGRRHMVLMAAPSAESRGIGHANDAIYVECTAMNDDQIHMPPAMMFPVQGVLAMWD